MHFSALDVFGGLISFDLKAIIGVRVSMQVMAWSIYWHSLSYGYLHAVCSAVSV